MSPETESSCFVVFGASSPGGGVLNISGDGGVSWTSPAGWPGWVGWDARVDGEAFFGQRPFFSASGHAALGSGSTKAPVCAGHCARAKVMIIASKQHKARGDNSKNCNK